MSASIATEIVSTQGHKSFPSTALIIINYYYKDGKLVVKNDEMYEMITENNIRERGINSQAGCVKGRKKAWFAIAILYPQPNILIITNSRKMETTILRPNLIAITRQLNVLVTRQKW